MNKREQIEDIQKILPNIEVVKAMYGDFDLAELLYDRGCRKISKNIESIWNKYDIKIDMLEKINTNLQELNENYYNEAKDLRREVNRLKAHAMINDEHLHIRIKEQARKETAKEIVDRLIEIFSTAKGVCSGCALQHDKAKNPTAREFQFGKYKGFEVAEYEVKELAKQYGVEVE